MIILFEAIKLVFFLLTLFLAIVLMRGADLFDLTTANRLEMVLMPAYLVFVGILLGYIGALIAHRQHLTTDQSHTVYNRMFIIGSCIGIMLALVYIFLI